MMGFSGIRLILMLLFWGALIVGGVWLVKTVFASSPQNHSGNIVLKQPSPHEIIDQRYARGEINREEYEKIKADLM
ncbi:MAG: SHOCT domain-containing protein [Chloroflexi bacterium]|nr:SHOCT domain-containing protein [Chloroflexota bacterium]MBU1662108.1 SHOCT domain-containing protein [Chloroflexota bacterium]